MPSVSCRFLKCILSSCVTYLYNALICFSDVFFRIQGGIPTKAIGPINEWWTTGFDGGENVVIGITTGMLEHRLLKI